MDEDIDKKLVAYMDDSVGIWEAECGDGARCGVRAMWVRP